MNIDGHHYRTIWLADDGWTVEIIDQTRLPHVFAVERLQNVEDAARAIEIMQVRGAPLIGAAAAYGVCVGIRNDPSDETLAAVVRRLGETRPTASNLFWALKKMFEALEPLAAGERVRAAYELAAQICDEDVETCRLIGVHGAKLISDLAKPDGAPVNVLTHCNAGWLATVDWGTALSPVYHAHNDGVAVHVWVDETRPRNQGASLTAFELARHGVPHTIICDNAGGHLMQQGKVDLCIVGTDRTAANGDVANKIGTYLKALAAHDNNVPFYVALPGSTIDWSLSDGAQIPIEERGEDEVLKMSGRLPDGAVALVEIANEGSPAANPAFDVTPARLVTGLITERGVCDASLQGLSELYPNHSKTR